jgi:hypothetical protein
MLDSASEAMAVEAEAEIMMTVEAMEAAVAVATMIGIKYAAAGFTFSA